VREEKDESDEDEEEGEEADTEDAIRGGGVTDGSTGEAGREAERVIVSGLYYAQ
jgi:hypothetical protein